MIGGIRPYAFLAGRILLSQLLIVNGVLQIRNWSSSGSTKAWTSGSR